MAKTRRAHQKEMRDLLTECERQGCRIVETRMGWRILCPAGGQVTVHASESDHKAMQATISRLRRNGLDF